jgi:hypothetical protein
MYLRMLCSLHISLAVLYQVRASEKPTLEQEIETTKSDCDYGRAIELLQRYIKQREREAIPNDILLAAAVRKKANLKILIGAGKVDRAQLWIAIAIDHAAPGRDHPVVGYDYTVIADVLVNEGLVPEAQAYYIQALTVLTRTLGPCDPRALLTFEKMGAMWGRSKTPGRRGPPSAPPSWSSAKS